MTRIPARLIIRKDGNYLQDPHIENFSDPWFGSTAPESEAEGQLLENSLIYQDVTTSERCWKNLRIRYKGVGLVEVRIAYYTGSTLLFEQVEKIGYEKAAENVWKSPWAVVSPVEENFDRIRVSIRPFGSIHIAKVQLTPGASPAPIWVEESYIPDVTVEYEGSTEDYRFAAEGDISLWPTKRNGNVEFVIDKSWDEDSEQTILTDYRPWYDRDLWGSGSSLRFDKSVHRSRVPFAAGFGRHKYRRVGSFLRRENVTFTQEMVPTERSRNTPERIEIIPSRERVMRGSGPLECRARVLDESGSPVVGEDFTVSLQGLGKIYSLNDQRPSGSQFLRTDSYGILHFFYAPPDSRPLVARVQSGALSQTDLYFWDGTPLPDTVRFPEDQVANGDLYQMEDQEGTVLFWGGDAEDDLGWNSFEGDKLTNLLTTESGALGTGTKEGAFRYYDLSSLVSTEIVPGTLRISSATESFYPVARREELAANAIGFYREGTRIWIRDRGSLALTADFRESPYRVLTEATLSLHEDLIEDSYVSLPLALQEQIRVSHSGGVFSTKELYLETPERIPSRDEGAPRFCRLDADPIGTATTRGDDYRIVLTCEKPADLTGDWTANDLLKIRWVGRGPTGIENMFPALQEGDDMIPQVERLRYLDGSTWKTHSSLSFSPEAEGLEKAKFLRFALLWPSDVGTSEFSPNSLFLGDTVTDPNVFDYGTATEAEAAGVRNTSAGGLDGALYSATLERQVSKVPKGLSQSRVLTAHRQPTPMGPAATTDRIFKISPLTHREEANALEKDLRLLVGDHRLSISSGTTLQPDGNYASGCVVRLRTNRREEFFTVGRVPNYQGSPSIESSAVDDSPGVGFTILPEESEDPVQIALYVPAGPPSVGHDASREAITVTIDQVPEDGDMVEIAVGDVNRIIRVYTGVSDIEEGRLGTNRTPEEAAEDLMRILNLHFHGLIKASTLGGDTVTLEKGVKTLSSPTVEASTGSTFTDNSGASFSGEVFEIAVRLQRESIHGTVPVLERR